VKQGELVNSIKGSKPSPAFALVGDDRIPKDAKLITKWCFNCPYWRIVSRGNGGGSCVADSERTKKKQEEV